MNANYIDGKLEEADMIRIVRMVLDQVNNETCEYVPGGNNAPTA